MSGPACLQGRHRLPESLHSDLLQADDSILGVLPGTPGRTVVNVIPRLERFLHAGGIDMERPIEIFFSYAHEDEGLVDEVRRHLVLFDRQNIIRKWHDRLIPPGTDWRGQIDSRLQHSDIVLLFISTDFFESDYCYETEMTEAMKRHGQGVTQVIPVILRPCMWHSAPFANLQALPAFGKPVTTWVNRDEACLSVAEGIMSVVHDLSSKSQAANVPLGPSRSQNPVSERPMGSDGESVAELSSFQCTSPLCRSQDLELTDTVEISSFKAEADGWSVHGVVQLDYCLHGRCRTCGRIFEAAKRQIPVQFPDLTCNECDRRAFLQYRVQELKRVAGGFEFTVEISCSGCRGRKKVTKLLTGLLDMVGIRVGLDDMNVKRIQDSGPTGRAAGERNA